MTEDWREMMRWKGYVVERCLGVGGFSKVYLLRDLQTGLEYAGKVSIQKEMLRKEYEILHKLSHPMFPEVYDYWAALDNAVLRMEYVPGVTLGRLAACPRDLAKTDGTPEQNGLSGQMVWSLGAKIAEGMAYLQNLHPPILYRDLKPENIMVQKDGSVKLLDFGCAMEYDKQDYRTVGTPGFAAPEQLAGIEVGLSADVYALGQTLMQVLNKADHSKDAKNLRKVLSLCANEKVEDRPPDMDAVLDLLTGRSTRDYPRWKKNVRMFGLKTYNNRS